MRRIGKIVFFAGALNLVGSAGLQAQDTNEFQRIAKRIMDAYDVGDELEHKPDSSHVYGGAYLGASSNGRAMPSGYVTYLKDNLLLTSTDDGHVVMHLVRDFFCLSCFGVPKHGLEAADAEGGIDLTCSVAAVVDPIDVGIGSLSVNVAQVGHIVGYEVGTDALECFGHRLCAKVEDGCSLTAQRLQFCLHGCRDMFAS